MEKIKKIKKIVNSIIFIMFLFSTFMLIRYSKLDNILELNFLNRPNEVSDVALSLFTSFEVTVFFYIIIEFIPNVIRQIEHEEEIIPYRCAGHRHVQLFTIKCINLYQEIMKEGNKKAVASNNIEDIFCISKVKVAALTIDCNSNSYVHLPNGTCRTWIQQMFYEQKEIGDLGKEILRYHKSDVPSDVYDAVFYINNHSCLFSEISGILNLIYQINGNNGTIGMCIAEDESNKDKTSEKIDILFKWVNNEYEKLLKMNCNNIYNINL